MFEWHALGHVPLSDSYTQPRRDLDGKSDVWDWFHINSIDLEPDGNLLSARATRGPSTRSATATARCCGASAASHELVHARAGRALRLAARRDAAAGRLDRDLRQRGHAGDRRRQSRGDRRRARLRRRTRRRCCTSTSNPGQAVLSPSQGDVQQLANGDQLVGWGQIGLVSEFSPTAALTFQLKLPPNVESYRAYRFPWSGAARRRRRSSRREPRRRRAPRRRSRRAGTGRPASPRGRCSPAPRRRRSRRSARRSPSAGFETADHRRDDRALRRRRGARHERPGARAAVDRRSAVSRRVAAPPAVGRAPRVVRCAVRCLRAPMTPTELDALYAFLVAAGVARAADAADDALRPPRRRDRPAARARALRPRDAAARRPRDLRRGRASPARSGCPHAEPWIGILLAAALITLVGALDDRFDFPPWLKLVGQIGAAVIAVAVGGVDVTLVTLPFFGLLNFPNAGPTLTGDRPRRDDERRQLLRRRRRARGRASARSSAIAFAVIAFSLAAEPARRRRARRAHRRRRARLPGPQLPARVELHGRRRLEPARPADGLHRRRRATSRPRRS